MGHKTRNDNAYEIELLGNDYAMSNFDLSSFFGPKGSKSRSTPQKQQDDEDIPHDSPLTNVEDDHDSRCTTQPCTEQANNVYEGPMTQARMKRLQHQVNSLLIHEHAYTKNDLLPNRGEMLVLRFEEYYMDGQATQRPKKAS